MDWWCYRVKKHMWGRENGGSEEATNTSIHANSRWHAPSWLNDMKSQHPTSRTEIKIVN